ncbi:hypothetical protein [Nonomuraea sp. NPDC048916]
MIALTAAAVLGLSVLIGFGAIVVNIHRHDRAAISQRSMRGVQWT